MKKLFFGAFVLTAMFVNAQTLSYNDIGTLLTQDDLNGTARFRGMSGAFGALGGDISATDINPAAGAVFNNSEASFSIGNRDKSTEASFYGTTTTSDENNFNFNQAGAIFVFDAENKNSNWKKFTFGINYSLSKDFDRTWIAKGNSGIADSNWTADPDNTGNPTTDIFYTNVDNQAFGTFEDGSNSKVNISFAGQHNENLYVGASINFNDVDYYQKTVQEEYLNDGSGNSLDVSSIQELATRGSGFSFGLGMISKVTDELRFGLSYKSPTWHTIEEEFIEEDLELTYSNVSATDSYYSGVGAFDYNLKTPGSVTGSLAYVFGKNGTISADYTYQNHANTKLTGNTDFSAQNQFFKDNMQATSSFRVGTEWRAKEFSFRGGYHFSQSPYKNATDEDKTGYSLGLGYNFGKVKVDLAYENAEQNSMYGFHAEPTVNSVNLNERDSKVTATVVFKL